MLLVIIGRLDCGRLLAETNKDVNAAVAEYLLTAPSATLAGELLSDAKIQLQLRTLWHLLHPQHGIGTVVVNSRWCGAT
jgi:hypothetical protein